MMSGVWQTVCHSVSGGDFNTKFIRLKRTKSFFTVGLLLMMTRGLCELRGRVINFFRSFFFAKNDFEFVQVHLSHIKQRAEKLMRKVYFV